MAVVVVGAAAGFAGIKVPFSKAVVLATIFMLGGLVLAAVRVPRAMVTLMVGVLAGPLP